MDQVIDFPPWEQATHCTAGPQPGALALMRWFVEEYGDEGGYNLGIYNCRPVRGSTLTTSCHGEGRALDWGFPVGDPDGNACLKKVLPQVGELGIQCIIYERRIYSAKSPTGRDYFGVNPHRDHLHVEITRESAKSLTYATVVDVMTPGLPRHKRGTRNLREGMSGTDVRFVQRRTGAEPDGYFGPLTKDSVKRYEESQKEAYPRIKADGIVGRITWRTLGINPRY